MRYVFVDEGSSFVKAMEIGKMDTFVSFPSRVVNKKVQDMTTETLISDRCYLVNGTTLSVHPSTDEPQTTANGEEYQTSDTNLALVHDAMRLLGCGGHDVDLCVTLPIGLFFSGDSVNHALIQKKKERLLSSIQNFNGLPLANIVNVTVRPEGFSIGMDALLDEQGALKPEYEHVRKIFVVDIGGTSTDMALMTDEGQIEKHRSSKNAMFPLRERLEQMITEAYPSLSDVPVSTMDHVLVKRTIGKNDVSELIQKAAEEQATGIIKDMNAFAGNMSSIDLLVIGGGGAYTIGQPIKTHFTHVTTVIPADPERSVVRGYEKYAAS